MSGCGGKVMFSPVSWGWMHLQQTHNTAFCSVLCVREEVLYLWLRGCCLNKQVPDLIMFCLILLFKLGFTKYWVSAYFLATCIHCAAANSNLTAFFIVTFLFSFSNLQLQLCLFLLLYVWGSVHFLPEFFLTNLNTNSSLITGDLWLTLENILLQYPI